MDTREALRYLYCGPRAWFRGEWVTSAYCPPEWDNAGVLGYSEAACRLWTEEAAGTFARALEEVGGLPSNVRGSPHIVGAAVAKARDLGFPTDQAYVAAASPVALLPYHPGRATWECFPMDLRGAADAGAKAKVLGAADDDEAAEAAVRATRGIGYGPEGDAACEAAALRECVGEVFLAELRGYVPPAPRPPAGKRRKSRPGT
jgi:hypothetical protein